MKTHGFAIALLFSIPAFGVECVRILSVSAVVRAAKALDGKQVCIDAKLHPMQPPVEVTLYEFLPVKDSAASGSAIRIGLVEWDKDLGIDEALYRPASDDLLERAAKACPTARESSTNYRVQVRGVVMYKKNFIQGVSKLMPSLFPLPSARYNYDVELVVLEIMKAKAECQKR